MEMSGDISVTTGEKWAWLEARDTAKHATNAPDSPITKNYLTQNVHRTTVEKPDLSADGL